MTRGAVLVCGSASGVGKSTVAAALCRSYARRGSRVAPFKAQNMSNHAAVTADGGEVGRAQAMQAIAAGVEVDRRMNPVLLKPSSPTGSHVVVLGDAVGTTDAGSYGARAASLKSVVLDAFTSLRHDYDLVVAEGAGGAAEINLLERDLVNVPLAAAADIPVIVVVDIDRGGAFASAYGTVELLPEPLRRHIKGFVFNSFRGDASLLESGCEELLERTGVPVLGVLPHLGDAPMLGVEDSLDVHLGATSTSAGAVDPLRVVSIRLPHLANPSDLDPLVLEPDVQVRWAAAAGDLAGADLIVLPGSRATVEDLVWLRRSGIADAVIERWTTGVSDVLGICAGYQMLGEAIDDPVESGRSDVPGFGVLGVRTTFEPAKIVRRSEGSWAPDVTSSEAASNEPATPLQGYQIRHGRPELPSASFPHRSSGAQSWQLEVDGESDGAMAVSRAGAMAWGTSLHGFFDSDAARRRFLGDVARRRSRTFRAAPISLLDAIDAQHERLADWLEAHVDIGAIDELIASAAAPGEGPGW